MNVQNHSFKSIIVGEFITLCKVEVRDAELIYKWRTNEVAQYLNQPKDYSIESQREWIRNRPKTEINYIIHRKDNFEQIGMIGIVEVDWDNRVSSVGRLLLDEQYIKQSTPYGVEALLLTYNYVFNIMDFRKITGTILGKNEKVFGLQKFLGMEQEGYLKKHVILRGNYEDLYVMSLIKEDFGGYKDKINTILSKFRN